MPKNQAELDAIELQEKQYGRGSLTPYQIQAKINEGTGQDTSVSELVGGAVEQVRNTFIPKQQEMKKPPTDLYDSKEEKDMYDQKFQNAKNSIKDNESYSEILNRLAKQKEQDSVDQMTLDHFKNVGQEPAMPAPPKFDNEQAKREALMEMMARKQNK